MARTPTLTSSVFLIAVLGGCASAPNPVHDLATNDDMYVDTGYRAAHKQARTAYVKPLLDRRKRLTDDATYPRTYTRDQFWERPVGEMLDDLVQREIREAGIFREVCDDEASADWVIEPVLLGFNGYVEERPVGRRTIGETTFHLRVLGKPDKNGKREVLRAVKIEAPAESGNRFAVDNPYRLATMAFRKAMRILLRELEEGGRVYDAVAGETEIDYDTDSKAWKKPAESSSREKR